MRLKFVLLLAVALVSYVAVDRVTNNVEAVPTGISWAATGDLPLPIGGNGLVAAQGYLFSIGGYTGDGTTTLSAVHRGAIDETGDVTWSPGSVNDLPATYAAHATASRAEHVYVLGGDRNGSATGKVLLSSVASDGTMSPWSELPSLPTPVTNATAEIVSGYIYVVGGFAGAGASSTVYMNKLNPDGTLANLAWAVAAPLPAPRYWHASTTVGHRIYVSGGQALAGGTTDVFEGTVDFDTGSLSWSAVAPLPAPRVQHSMEAVSTRLFVIAGSSSANPPQRDTVYTVTVRPGEGGTSGAWEAEPNPYGEAVHLSDNSAVVDGRIYVAGGDYDAPQAESANTFVLFAPNQMALDADANGSGVQTTRTISGTETFRIGIHITQIAQPYYAYIWAFTLPSGLGYSSQIVENTLGTGLVACQPPLVSATPNGTLFHSAGCRGTFQNTLSSYVGQTTSLSLHCAANGTYFLKMENSFHVTGGSGLLSATALDYATGATGIFIECTNVSSPPTDTPVLPTPTPAPDAPNVMALDSNPDTLGIQTTRVVAGSDPFKVGIAVASLGSTPYAGYQWQFEFPPSGLAFEGGVVENIAATGLAICNLHGPGVPPPIVPGNLVIGGAAGCLGFGGPATWLGELTRLELSCVALGSFEVRLHDYVHDPFFGSSLTASNGAVLPTTTTNITITCVDPPTVTPTATATATATPTAAGPAIEGFAKDADTTAVDADPIGNLWICKGAGFPADFTGPDADLPPNQQACNELIIGEFLRIGPDRDTCNDDDDGDGIPCESMTSENYIPGQTACCDPDELPEGIGAWELQIKYDHKLFQQPIATCEQGPFGARSVQPQVSVITENWSLFGCVSKSEPQGQDQIPFVPGADGFNGYASFVTLTIQPDLFQRLRPTKDNGVVTDLLDENCEVADAFGMPWPGSVQGGLLPDCRDVTITIRMLEGDINLDCAVDLADDQEIAFRYGAFFGNLLYNEFYDLEPNLAPDFDIDIKDLQTVFGRNGSTCANPIPDQDPRSPVPDP